MSKQSKFVYVREHLLNLKQCKHGGLVKKAAEEYNIPEHRILDASASLNPYGTPFEHEYTGLNLENLIKDALKRADQYPDNRYLNFKSAASKFVGCNPENIIPGNGSSEIIRLVAEATIEKGDIVLIPSPTFSEYEQQCSIFGAEIKYIKQEILPEITDEILSSARILFVCNPNNPTGKLLSREELIHIIEKCKQNNVIIFVDEAFIELSDPSKSIVDLVETNEHLFVQRSLTKAFAIPGIRMGFGVTSTKTANLLNKIRLPWNLGCIAEEISIALMSMENGCYSTFLEESRKMITAEKNYMMEKLVRRGFNPYPSSVNYIFVDISDLSMDSIEFTSRIAAHGVLIRDCSSFQDLGNNYIRIAVRTREENDRIIESIRETIQEWGQEQAKINLKQNMEIAKKKGRIGSNTSCKYYPCHKKGQDCTFCFCPFYPCEDERTMGEWIIGSSGNPVWSCLKCTIIHEPDVVKQLVPFLHENVDDNTLKSTWKKVIDPWLQNCQ